MRSQWADGEQARQAIRRRVSIPRLMPLCFCVTIPRSKDHGCLPGIV